MAFEEYTLPQIQFISTLKTSLSSEWLVNHHLANGKIFINVYGPKSTGGTTRDYVARIDSDGTKDFVLVRIDENVPGTYRLIFLDALSKTTSLTVYQI